MATRIAPVRALFLNVRHFSMVKTRNIVPLLLASGEDIVDRNIRGTLELRSGETKPKLGKPGR